MFYKILPANLCTYGFQYKIGINCMEHAETLGKTVQAEYDSYEAGLYFADDENILAYCHYGDCIATVEIADGATLEYWGNGEYSTDMLEILEVRPLWNINTLRELVKEGVKFSVDNNAILSWAEEYGKTDIVEFLRKEIFKL